ncbi:MAG: transposase [Acidobacteria bacterium]|nr:transposase [Acidobacteriota bacterium]
MSNTRRRFTPEQKAQIVRRHLSGKEAVSALADEFDLQPTQIHLWVNQLLAQAEKAFERANGPRQADDAKERRIEQLEAKLVQKNEVISELMEDNVRSKKANGEL